MMYATKIRMKRNCQTSTRAQEIADIYVDGCDSPGFFSKEALYDYLVKNPRSIKVGISPYPFLLPAISSSGEKYVRSEPNDTPKDNLLKLPRS
jgi:hypothetical protein